MLFGSSKETNRLLKEIYKLLSKGMWNIYLEVTIEEKWRSNFQNFISRSVFWGAPTHADITEFSIFLLQLRNQSCESKTMCGYCIIIIIIFICII